MQLASPKFDFSELDQIKLCLDSGWVTQGPAVVKFEELVAKRHQVKYACATTSCTAALHLAMLASGIKSGDEVVVPAFTWVTSAHCAEYVGATVRFADVDPNTFNIDPAAFEAAITCNTKAVVVVHLFGHAADMDAINSIAKKHNIMVIEDAACAIGTAYAGKPVGGFGLAGCFSFHPRKVITTGEGGMILTNDENIASLVNSYRCHGFSGYPKTDSRQNKPYTMGSFDHLGFNLRLSDILASVGIAQMKKLEGLLKERRELADAYSAHLESVDGIVTPKAQGKSGHTYQSYVVRVIDGGRERRNKIMEFFAERDIQTRPGTHAVHRLGYYANKYKLKHSDYPNASISEDTTITLPIFPGMSEAELAYVVESLKQALLKTQISQI